MAITIGRNNVIFIRSLSFRYLELIREWCNENLSDRWEFLPQIPNKAYRLKIHNDEEFMLFVLTWKE